MKTLQSALFFAIPFFLLVRALTAIETVLFLLSALLHEAGHFLVLLFFGYRKKTAFSLSPAGAILAIDTTFLPYRKEILVYLAGPTFNLIGMGVTLLLLRQTFTFPLLYFFFCNALLCSINLVPIEGLDGYQALFSFICLFHTPEKAKQLLAPINALSCVLLLVASLALFVLEKNLSLLLLIASLLIEGKTKKATKIS